MKKYILTLLLVMSTTLAWSQKSKYLSYDWAFFELKDKVEKVTYTYSYQDYNVIHEFNIDGDLLDEESYGGPDGYNPFGFSRDSINRICSTGNEHTIWTWKGMRVLSSYYLHLGYEYLEKYTYDNTGKKTGHIDKNGKRTTYKYLKFDSHGNWTSRKEGKVLVKRFIEYF